MSGRSCEWRRNPERRGGSGQAAGHQVPDKVKEETGGVEGNWGHYWGSEHLPGRCWQPRGRLGLEGLRELGPESPELWGTRRRPVISGGGPQRGRDSRESERARESQDGEDLGELQWL